MHRPSLLRALALSLLVALQPMLPDLAWAQQVGQGSGAAPVGLVNTITGSVFRRPRNGQEVPLKPGDLFGPGTTFRSGADSSLILIFADGQKITLGSDAELRIDDYRFDGANARTDRSAITLVNGVMSYVTGAIHTENPLGLSIVAGSASIGIISKDVTAFVVDVDARAQALGIVSVTVGQITVRNSVGAATVQADQFVRVQSGSAPSSPAPLAAAPAFFQAMVTAMRATVLAEGQPVDVQAAALRAALAALPATAAGQPDQVVVVVVTPAVGPAAAPGGGGSCVGSPC